MAEKRERLGVRRRGAAPSEVTGSRRYSWCLASRGKERGGDRRGEEKRGVHRVEGGRLTATEGRGRREG